MAARSRRGRPTPVHEQNSMLPLYGVLALAVIAGLALLALSLSQPAVSTTARTANVDIDSLGNYPAKGNLDAPVTVVEYADYQCPACAIYANSLSAQIDRDYVDTGKVRFIYHDLPIPSHANAVPAAEAARAAGDQGKYWEMNQLLFARQQEWASLPQDQATAKFNEYAQELGLDTATFSETLASGKYRVLIEQAYEDAMAANIQFTPSFVVDGKIYSQEQLKSAIDAALAAE